MTHLNTVINNLDNAKELLSKDLDIGDRKRLETTYTDNMRVLFGMLDHNDDYLRMEYLTWWSEYLDDNYPRWHGI